MKISRKFYGNFIVEERLPEDLRIVEIRFYIYSCSILFYLSKIEK